MTSVRAWKYIQSEACQIHCDVLNMCQHGGTGVPCKTPCLSNSATPDGRYGASQLSDVSSTLCSWSWLHEQLRHIPYSIHLSCISAGRQSFSKMHEDNQQYSQILYPPGGFPRWRDPCIPWSLLHHAASSPTSTHRSMHDDAATRFPFLSSISH